MRSLPSPVVLVLAVAASFGVRAQDPQAVPDPVARDAARLDAQRITGPEFRSRTLGPVRWLDGTRFATLERDDEKRAFELVQYDAESGAREVLIPADSLRRPGDETPLQIEDYAISTNRGEYLVFTESQRVWRQNTRGEYFVVRPAAASPPLRVGGSLPKSSLMFAQYSPDGSAIAFVSGNDVYIQDDLQAEPRQVTTGGSRTLIHGTFDWVYEEEFDCRCGFRFSPDGTRIAFWELDCSSVGEFYMVDNLADRYSKIVPVQYPKAGTSNSACRIGVIDVEGGDVTWMALPGDPREIYLPRMEWHLSGKELMVQWLPRSQNELRIYAADAATGAVRLVHTETDAAWVDVRDDFRWLQNGEAYFWTSDRDGWRHAYVQPWGKGEARLLTPGDYDVNAVLFADLDRSALYFARSHRSTEQQLAALLPGGVEFVTHEWRQSNPKDGNEKESNRWPAIAKGWHDYDVSKDGSLAIHTHSSFDVPPRIEVVRLPSHETVRVLEDNAALRARYAEVERFDNEFFQVSTKDGVSLDGFVMYPKGFTKDARWPVVFYVYGEPWAQTVTDSWNLRHHLFHRWLTQMGYVVMSIDARGTPAPKGRAWRKALHQKIGVLSSQDWNEAVEALCGKHEWMDRTRLAVWGWSGGGAMTLNLLFRYPELFQAGMAVAPVTDIALYDTIYQERYCGDPRLVPEVYRACSPITFASQLQGALLLVHGTGDDNVHWQHSERLFDALVAHGKRFEYLAYPNRTHAIAEGAGTRAHLYDSLADFLRRR
ncbi:MAG: DPP IV N-terminal domain-containing protein, partial [Planctomycetota bacterium]